MVTHTAMHPHASHTPVLRFLSIPTLLLSLTLALLTTIAIAWALACTNIPARGVGSSQTLLPTRGPVALAHINTPKNGLKVQSFSATGRTVLWISIGGPDAPMYLGSAAYFFEKTPTPPDELVPSSLRAIATPWLVDPSKTPWPRGEDTDWRTIEASGFPLLALASINARAPNYTHEQTWSLPLPGKRMRTLGEHSYGPSSPCTLPLRPLFPGFLLNTFLFAALWYPILLIPRALRRALRNCRNQCPNCGYSRAGLAASSPCPECGGTAFK